MKKFMRKYLAIFFAIAMLFSVCAVFAGCGEGNDETTGGPIATLPPVSTTENTTVAPDTTKPVVTETTTGSTVPPVVPTGKYTNPLTGEPNEEDLSNIRPLAIVVDNHLTSLAHQSGLTDADILYEALVAPGITRFLAVYADYRAVDGVCNIRSGRDYHLDLASFHHAVLMCHGASNTENYDFYQLAKDRLGSRWGFVDTQFEKQFATAENGLKYGTIAHVGDRIDLKYDTIYKKAAFEDMLNSKYSNFVTDAGGSMNGYAKESLKFLPYGQDKDMTGASTANNVDLKFETQGAVGAWNVNFTYNPATGKYLRSQNGQPHRDAVSGQQLAFTNVITLLTDVTCVKTGIANDPYMTLVNTRTPSGVGYYFNGGKVIEITWYSNGNELQLVDPLGNTLTLESGNSYIAFLDGKFVRDGQTFWN